ncbi:MAG TPA: aspartate kinase [Dehalococcoidia bacterium]|nr:aspartate kinase [Dehalococcoidia bacterium]
MSLIVQKYGGTSLAGAERIRAVAARVSARKQAGNDLVVVVSAMGDTTDELIALAQALSPEPDPRELDLLLSTGEVVSGTLMAIALRSLGHQAISLTGAQAGILTDRSFRRARIQSVDPARIRRELAEGKIVVVAGFQGVSEDLDVTTLGRGGSDTTAVAMAASLRADACEIYTDVTGIYTADPRVAPSARQLQDISYDEMLELAAQGARVMHPRAVELGQIFGIPILVASSFSDQPGTIIRAEVHMESRNKVRGIAHDLGVARITVIGVPDRPGVAAALFEPLAQAGISVDIIVQNASHDDDAVTDLSFTIARDDLPEAGRLMDPIVRELGARDWVSSGQFGKVSIVGTGMQSAPGYAARMFRALHQADINIHMITTSEIRITCIVAEDQVPAAVRALHEAFALEQGD